MDPTALHIPLDQSNFLLGCFCVSLIQGDNILGLNLKSSTIKEYMKAAADLYPQRSRNLEKPFQHPSLEVDYPLVLIKALKKYEEVPNRREVITDSMFCYIDNLAHKYMMIACTKLSKIGLLSADTQDNADQSGAKPQKQNSKQYLMAQRTKH